MSDPDLPGGELPKAAAESSAPAETDADLQSEQTVMPWLWGAVGLLAIFGFAGWLLIASHQGHTPPHPPAAAPLTNPPASR
jgi:hypothetical protein